MECIPHINFIIRYCKQLQYNRCVRIITRMNLSLVNTANYMLPTLIIRFLFRVHTIVPKFANRIPTNRLKNR